ncbi:hypothetical protein JB92DRAFT_3289299 [Gautieria morchelliformis]|nr:hypothetical protein JB92DRAFT_3289299 [Gautieria morchelliformis]
MIGLGSNHQDDADTYKDILRSVRSHCRKNLDLSLPMRKQVKAKTVLVELKVKSSKANRAPDNRQAAPPVVSDVPITKGTSSSKSKPKFQEQEEEDLRCVAASMASKKGVSGVKRKKPVEDDDGPGPSKRYKTLSQSQWCCIFWPNESTYLTRSFQPAKGKEKVSSRPFVAWPLLTRLQTAKKTKVAKGASDKKSSSTATGSSGVRKTKRQLVPSARARGDHP